MRIRYSGALTAALLSALLVGCNETTSTDPGAAETPATEATIPAGESVGELQAATERELDALRQQETTQVEGAGFRSRKTIVELAQGYTRALNPGAGGGQGGPGGRPVRASRSLN